MKPLKGLHLDCKLVVNAISNKGMDILWWVFYVGTVSPFKCTQTRNTLHFGGLICILTCFNYLFMFPYNRIHLKPCNAAATARSTETCCRKDLALDERISTKMAAVHCRWWHSECLSNNVLNTYKHLPLLLV